MLGPCLFVQGVISPWCWAGVNRPIFTEVVRPQLRASILAYAVVLEGSSAALGAPLVGHLAEAFGYRTLAADAADAAALRATNADALARAISTIALVCWATTFCMYGLVHLTYARDRHAAASSPPCESDTEVEDEAAGRPRGKAGAPAAGRARGRGARGARLYGEKADQEAAKRLLAS